ncbi:hypothetical protein L1049_021798 [Liquidambar formosana]|uniref:60S acidic ribosomal protein P1 n=1 Tax=Liquidambar formosana TaxID=63359 RepID=A0AAP0RBG4_LIQFO
MPVWLSTTMALPSPYPISHFMLLVSSANLYNILYWKMGFSLIGSDQAEKIAALVKAANVTVDSYWPSLFSKLVEKRNIEDLIMNVGSGGGGAPVAVATSAGGAAPAAAAAPAAEEKKEEPKEESDDDMGFSLFD